MIPETGTRSEFKAALTDILPKVGEKYLAWSNHGDVRDTGMWRITSVEMGPRWKVHFEDATRVVKDGEPIPCWISFRDWWTYVEEGWLIKQ